MIPVAILFASARLCHKRNPRAGGSPEGLGRRLVSVAHVSRSSILCMMGTLNTADETAVDKFRKKFPDV